MRVKAIRVKEPGGPEVLRLEQLELGAPGSDELLVRHTAIGLNFLDIYFRDGSYPVPAYPYTPGNEAAGVVEAVGIAVQGFSVGDRVAYTTGPMGAYAEGRLLLADHAVKLPQAISDRTAAAIMLKGLTAWYLLRQTHILAGGETILFHAAAGGVGSLAVPWAKYLGATVIGTAGTPAKCELARQSGCDHAIDYNQEKFADRVREITDGRGVDVVYDSVGRDTFTGSLDSLRRRGLMVSFGQASGKVEPVDIGILNTKGSLYLTRPSLFSYIDNPVILRQAAGELFALVEQGVLGVQIGQSYPLSEVATAHAELQGRRTTGSSVLIP